nr:unnamed protein product [Callosobruchus analis]
MDVAYFEKVLKAKGSMTNYARECSSKKTVTDNIFSNIDPDLLRPGVIPCYSTDHNLQQVCYQFFRENVAKRDSEGNSGYLYKQLLKTHKLKLHSAKRAHFTEKYISSDNKPGFVWKLINQQFQQKKEEISRYNAGQQRQVLEHFI